MNNNNQNLEPDFIEPKFYTVQKNDTLRKISQKLFGTPENYKKIMELNNLTSSTIFPGQILRIPENFGSNIIFYRVKPGDTLWKISEKYLNHGYKYQEIMSTNNLTSDMIYPGQILKIII